jgi:hypothetical protein
VTEPPRQASGAPRRPGEEIFTEEDLAPSAAERRAARRALAERIAVVAAVLSAGVWAGGLVALGACAAPFVFALTPYPFSGDAMGAAFARFDGITIGCATVLLGSEIVRTVAARGRQTLATRLRRYVAILMAAGAVYASLLLTPRILELHRQGARRNVGSEGAELERVHGRAELVAKAELALATLLVALHVFTLRAARDDDADDEEALAPLPPGPPGP